MTEKLQAVFLTVALTAAPVLASAPSQVQSEGPETVNTLDYFVSKHLDKGLAGTHTQNQVVTGNVSYYVKWATDAFEVHTWDNDYIYLSEDHGWKPDQAYAFRPGKWMKRVMRIGESIVQTGNQGYYFSADTCAPLEINPLPYTMTLEAHIPDYDLGGELGSQDIIQLRYDYSSIGHPGAFERFYYSKDWGWVKWELYENYTLVKTSLFNETTGRPLQPNTAVSCTRGGISLPDFSAIAAPQNLLQLRLNQAVQVPGDSAIYYLDSQGQREYVCSPQVLWRHGLRITDIQEISPEELTSYPLVEYVRWGNSGEVYKLEGERRRLVTVSAFDRLDINNLPQVDPLDFVCYGNGDPLI